MRYCPPNSYAPTSVADGGIYAGKCIHSWSCPHESACRTDYLLGASGSKKKKGRSKVDEFYDAWGGLDSDIIEEYDSNEEEQEDTEDRCGGCCGCKVLNISRKIIITIPFIFIIWMIYDLSF